MLRTTSRRSSEMLCSTWPFRMMGPDALVAGWGGWASTAHGATLRRVRRLVELGVIERQLALLNPDRLAQAIGHGLNALVEVSLDRQGAEHLDAFEARAVADPAVQQCWRVSPGPDFVLVVAVRDMPGYQALAQRLFTQDANVRNVRSFFSLKRAKFAPALPLPEPAQD